MSTLGVPLAVRLKAARSDIFVSREVMDLSFASAIPGGFSSATLRLHRPLSQDPPELDMYTTMYVYDQGGQVLWQGRLEDPGRASGPSGEVWTVNAVGPAAHARDRTVPIIYVDTNLERWLPYNGNVATGFIQKITDGDTAASGLLKAGISDGATAVFDVFRQGHQYNAIRECGQHTARWSFTWDTGVTDVNWQVRTRHGNGTLLVIEDDIDWNTAGGSVAKVITTDYAATSDCLAFTIERLVSSALTVGDGGYATWASVVVRGTIYTTAGVEDTAGASYGSNTILASTVVQDLLGRLLNKFDGPNAVIATTSFAISQLAYPDGVTAAKVLDDLMIFEPGYFWAAWEDTANAKAKFEFSAWPTSVTLEASAKDGFDSPGSASELYNTVSVRWRDILGRIRTTRRTNTVAVLDAAGLTREAFIDLGDEMGNSLNADRAGDQFLLEHASPPNAGTLTVRTPILSITLGRMLYPWELVRHAPGKLIRVRDVKPRVDALNATARDAVTVFKVMGAEYNARDNSCRLALDSQPKVLTRLLSPLTMVDYRRR